MPPGAGLIVRDTTVLTMNANLDVLPHHDVTVNGQFINYFYTLAFAGRGDDVVTTIVDGKILMQDRVIKSLDEANVLRQAQRCSDRIFAGDSL